MSQSLRGNSAIKSCSISTGSVCFVQPSRWLMRCTWVSTTTPSGVPNATPSTTLAVLRPTPGSLTSSAERSRNPHPHVLSSSRFDSPMTFLVFCRYMPILLSTFSTSGGSAFASALGVGQRL